jgi:hypothetical protein
MGQGLEGGEGRGANVLLSGGTTILCDGAAPGTRVVRVLDVVMAAPCYAAASVCVGVAAECARLRLTAPGSVSTKTLLVPNNV